MSSASSDPALFLFDVDGTLIRAGTAVHRDSFAHAFKEVYGLPLTLEGMSAAGRTDAWLLAEPLRREGLTPEQIAEGAKRAYADMEAYVDEHLGDLRDRVLPGVREVLDDLHQRGQLIGLLTGNLKGIAMAKMQHADLARYFDCGGFGEESETRADLVPVALEHASHKRGRLVSPHRAALIGDTPLDIEAARAHDLRAIAVATGPFTEEALREAGAHLVLPSLEDADAVVNAMLALFAEG